MANVASGLPFPSGCLLTRFSSPSSMCDAGPLLLPASSVPECPSPQHPPRGPSPLWLATVAAEGPSRLLLPAGLKNDLPQVSGLWAVASLTGDFHQEFAGKYYSALVPPPSRLWSTHIPSGVACVNLSAAGFQNRNLWVQGHLCLQNCPRALVVSSLTLQPHIVRIGPPGPLKSLRSCLSWLPCGIYSAPCSSCLVCLLCTCFPTQWGQENGGPERLNHSPEVTQVLMGKAEIRTWGHQASGPGPGTYIRILGS